jgi:uncharacterized protein
MKWDEMRRSDNVEDERESGGSSSGSSGGMTGLVGGLGAGGAVIAVILGLIFKVNPAQIMGLIPSNTPAPAKQSSAKPKNDRDSDFVRAVLGDTEDTWSRIFKEKLNSKYQPPKLVLFSGSVNSACGSAQTASGPFYCPADQKAYLDMAFFQYLEATAGDDADFARSYAIAHEVAHHVQNILGTSSKVRQLKASSSRAKANELSVRIELQADCYAGIWGYHTAQRGLIGDRDVEKALNTASQIGDDYLQKRAKGTIAPDSFTHGSSEQRVRWFKRGFSTGDINQCDTFNTDQL